MKSKELEIEKMIKENEKTGIVFNKLLIKYQILRHDFIKYCHKNGIDIQKYCINVDDTTKGLIVKDYLKGLSSSRLQRKYCVSRGNITRYVKEAGHEIKLRTYLDGKLTSREDIDLKKYLFIITRNAKDRSIKYQLSKNDLKKLIYDNCQYCGGHNKNKFNSIDRVDSTKGYFIENCVSCCNLCNFFKNNMTLNEFKKWISTINISNIDKLLENQEI